MVQRKQIPHYMARVETVMGYPLEKRLRDDLANLERQVQQLKKEISQCPWCAEPKLVKLREILKRSKRVYEEAIEERNQFIEECERDAHEYLQKDDMNKYNFYMGKVAGANWADIYYRRVVKKLEKSLKE